MSTITLDTQLQEAKSVALRHAQALHERAQRAGWENLTWLAQEPRNGVQTNVLSSGTRTIAIVVVRYDGDKYQVASQWLVG